MENGKLQSLQKQRILRLRGSKSILGQPDLITIHKITTIPSFLSHKKQAFREETFVFGLNFPTTAHFSSFINQKLNYSKNMKGQHQYKIKLFIFDVFASIDWVVQLNIPGTVSLRAFQLTGQQVNTHINYQSAYYSSILRSLYPYCYHPNTQIYGQVEKFECLNGFINTFISFALKNQISVPEQAENLQNIAIWLIINYLQINSLWNLSKILQQNLQIHNQKLALLFQISTKQLKGEHKDIIILCANELLKQNMNGETKIKLLEYQLRALYELGKKSDAKSLGDFVLRLGLDCLKTWEYLLRIYLQDGDDIKFFKILNTAVNFSGEEQILKDRIEKLVLGNKVFNTRQEFDSIYSPKITKNPQLMLKFDYKFLQQQTTLPKLAEAFLKTQKQKTSFQLLQKMNQSMKQQTFFQRLVALYQKSRSWNKLVQIRSQCFWLENDYAQLQNNLKKPTDISSRSQASNSSDKNKQSATELTKTKIKPNLAISESLNSHQKSKFCQQNENQEFQQSFDGQFSECDSQYEQQINVVAPCSKRVVTKRVLHEHNQIRKMQSVKIICVYNLEKIFLTTYYNLKLHNEMQKWISRLDISGVAQFSKPKKQFISYFILKKAIFHKNMFRFRKSQQTFKNARKFINNASVSLVSCYCLMKLYLEHKNIKGVEYYTLELVRIIMSMGVVEFEAVPIWAKQMIPFIISHYGCGITKRLQNPLKHIVELWLSIDNQIVHGK